jgi:hypothetical protein
MQTDDTGTDEENTQQAEGDSRQSVVMRENTEHDRPIKPPLGIEPELIWKQKRCYELVRAISRYDDANKGVDGGWFEELGELIPQVFPQGSSELRKSQHKG